MKIQAVALLLALSPAFGQNETAPAMNSSTVENVLDDNQVSFGNCFNAGFDMGLCGQNETACTCYDDIESKWRYLSRNE